MTDSFSQTPLVALSNPILALNSCSSHAAYDTISSRGLNRASFRNVASRYTFLMQILPILIHEVGFSTSVVKLYEVVSSWMGHI